LWKKWKIFQKFYRHEGRNGAPYFAQARKKSPGIDRGLLPPSSCAYGCGTTFVIRA
jgi:hypothetical protein